MTQTKGARGAVKLAGVALCVALASTVFGQLGEAWAAIYDSPGGGQDDGYAIAVDNAGNVYVAGRGTSATSTFDDFVTVKYDSAGNLLWERLYDGTAGTSDHPVAIAVDSAGSVFVTGSSFGGHAAAGGTWDDFATVKYDKDGNQLWVRRYTSPGVAHDRPVSMALDSAGNLYVTGFSQEGPTTTVTLKYDTNGDVLWTRRYGGSPFLRVEPVELAVSSDGSVYVAVNSDTEFGSDFLTLKYSPAGDLMWVANYGAPHMGIEGPRGLGLDDEGNVYVAGASATVQPDGTLKPAYVALKYDKDGTELWRAFYDGFPNLSARGMAVDGAGSVFVMGTTYTFGKGEWMTVKIDSSGAFQWSKMFESSTQNDSNYPRAIEVDVAGNVYVTGDSYRNFETLDYTTLKYDTNGALVWHMRYDFGDTTGAAFALTLDDLANVYVTGTSNWSMVTVKYTQGISFAPDQFSVPRGFLTGGGLGDLSASDDQRLEVRAGLTLFLGESPLQIVVEAAAPSDSPGELRFTLEAMVNTPGLTQTIELFNYDTGSYEEVDFWLGSSSDEIVSIAVTSGTGRFIEDGTLRMKARISYRAYGLTLVWPWTASLDQAAWTIIP